MKTNLLSLVRTKRTAAAFRYGRSCSDRLHVSTSPRQIIRYWHSRFAKTRKDRGPDSKRDRLALYFGAFSGLRTHRRLMRAFSL